MTALTSLLLPSEGETGKYVRHIAGLITIFIIIEPLSGLSEVIGEEGFEFDLPFGGEDTLPDYRETVIKEAEARIEADVKSELFKIFRISDDHVSVSVTLDANDYTDVTVDTIVITLKSYGAWADSGEIRRYFEEKYYGAVYVNYD